MKNKEEYFLLFENSLIGAEDCNSYIFTNPLDVITASNSKEILEAFEKIDYYSKKYYIAGYFAYELGYYLDRAYTGKGYASEASKRAIQFIFEDLHAYKIIIITRDTNEPSFKLAERLGFEKEGHFKESNIEDGKRFGLLYYALFRKDWESKK